MIIRLGQASRELNVGHDSILKFLSKKGFTVKNNPNAKLTREQYAMLSKEFTSSASEKQEANNLTIGSKQYPPPSKQASGLTSGGKKHVKKKKRTKPELNQKGKAKKKGKKKGRTKSRSVWAIPTHFESNRRRH